MKICFSSLAFLAVLLVSGWSAGVRLNFTASEPRGVYRETREAPARGDLVSFCLESTDQGDQARRYLRQSLLCPNGLQPLLKELVALPGDRVDVLPEGLSINGRPVPDSKIREEDAKGRNVVSCLVSGPVPEGMALALGDKAGSFDGRYFGFVPLRSCRRVIPILTF